MGYVPDLLSGLYKDSDLDYYLKSFLKDQSRLDVPSHIPSSTNQRFSRYNQQVKQAIDNSQNAPSVADIAEQQNQETANQDLQQRLQQLKHTTDPLHLPGEVLNIPNEGLSELYKGTHNGQDLSSEVWKGFPGGRPTDHPELTGGVEGIYEGILNPANAMPAGGGLKAGLGMLLAGVPGIADSVSEAGNLPANERTAQYSKLIASGVLPLLMGAGHGGGEEHASGLEKVPGEFQLGEHALDIPDVRNEQLPAFSNKATKMDVDNQTPVQAADSLHISNDINKPLNDVESMIAEERFKDAEKATNELETIEKHPINEVNTDVRTEGMKRYIDDPGTGLDDITATPFGHDLAHEVALHPAAIRLQHIAQLARDIVNPEGGKSNLGIIATPGETPRGTLGYAVPGSKETQLSPAVLAQNIIHELAGKDLKPGELANRFVDQMFSTQSHEDIHARKGGPTHEGAEQGRFERLNTQQALDTEGARRYGRELVQSSDRLKLTDEDVIDLARIADKHSENLNLPEAGEGRIGPLREKLGLPEEIRVGTPEMEGIIGHEFSPQGIEPEKFTGPEVARSEVGPKLEEDFPQENEKAPSLEEDFPSELEEDFPSEPVPFDSEHPADKLFGVDLTKLSKDQLKLFESLKTGDSNELVKTSSNPAKAASLIIQAQQPSVRGSIRKLLVNSLLQQNGLPPIPPKKGGLPPVPKRGSYNNPINSFEDYVGKTQAANVRRDLKALEFEKYKSQGQQGLHDYEANPKAFPDLQKFFADELARQKAAGVPIRELQNYLPHMFDGSPAQLQAYRSYLVQNRKKLGLRPGHTLPRQIASYEIAEKVFGLRPKFDNLSDLAAQYHFQAEKAIADRGLYNWLKDTKQLSTTPKAGFTEIPNGIPSISLRGKNGQTITSKWYAAEPVATKLNNYFNDAGVGTQNIARASTGIRNLALGGGIPGTGLNSLGYIFHQRYVTSAPTVAKGIQRFVGGLKDLVYTKGAEGKLLDIMHEIPDAVENGGLMLGGFGHSFQRETRSLGQRLRESEPLKTGSNTIDNSRIGRFLGSSLGKVGEVVSTAFDRPLLNRVAPLWKMTVYTHALEGLKKQGVPETLAKLQAGEFANTVMSGENWERKGRSRAWHTRAQAIWLSPELLRSNWNLGKGIAKSVIDTVTNKSTPEGKLYRRYASAFVTLYALHEVLAKSAGGRWSFQNPPGHLFDIYAGDKDKEHERYISPYYTSQDWIRLPFEVAYSLYHGDEGKAFEMFMGRLNPLINTAVHLGTNRDFTGERYVGQGIPAGRGALNVATEIGKNFIPPSGVGVIEAGKELPGVSEFVKKHELGRPKSAEELLAQTFEGPEKFVKKRKQFDEPLGLFDFNKKTKKAKGGVSYHR